MIIMIIITATIAAIIYHHFLEILENILEDVVAGVVVPLTGVVVPLGVAGVVGLVGELIWIVPVTPLVALASHVKTEFIPPEMVNVLLTFPQF
jgi:hypothetical protein